MSGRSSARALAAITVAAVLAACGSGSKEPRGQASPNASSSPTTASTTSPPAANQWPFAVTACEGAGGDPLLMVALGTSETAGSGVREDEAYSPQEAYPARHADILCHQLGRPVTLHSYFPSQGANELAKVAWWIDKLRTDRVLRADLAEADVVDMWPLNIHDVVAATYLGGCSGDWPDPLKGCLQKALRKTPRQLDQAYALIDRLVPADTTVLAADAFIPPDFLRLWGDTPYWKDVNATVDPRYPVTSAARKHGYVLVDTQLTLNGKSRKGIIGPDLIQSDGIHPTAGGQQVIAETFAAADGLG